MKLSLSSPRAARMASMSRAAVRVSRLRISSPCCLMHCSPVARLEATIASYCALLLGNTGTPARRIGPQLSAVLLPLPRGSKLTRSYRSR